MFSNVSKALLLSLVESVSVILQFRYMVILELGGIFAYVAHRPPTQLSTWKTKRFYVFVLHLITWRGISGRHDSCFGILLRFVQTIRGRAADSGWLLPARSVSSDNMVCEVHNDRCDPPDKMGDCWRRSAVVLSILAKKKKKSPMVDDARFRK